MAKTDDQITQNVLADLTWDYAVTIANLIVSTNDEGVQGIDDEITINQQGTSGTDIAAGIAAAFARNAELLVDGINVTTNGSHVTLWGTVATWSEYEMAEDIAWMSPGVTSVTNDIAVLFP
jgi:osmotically-inducible protein OsmY